MSKEEMQRLEVMKQLQEKRMNQRTAAEGAGGECPAGEARAPQAYRGQGALGLVSKQRGQPGHHQMDPRNLSKGNSRAISSSTAGALGRFGQAGYSADDSQMAQTLQPPRTANSSFSRRCLFNPDFVRILQPH